MKNNQLQAGSQAQNWKSNSYAKWLVAFIAGLAWCYVTYRFWQFEPAYTLRFVVFSGVAVALLYLSSKFLTRKGTSLKALVVGGPIAIAVFTIPMRSVVYHQQLLDKLSQARIEEFSLGNTNPVYQFLQRHVTTVLGSHWGDAFSNELNTLRIDLDLVEADSILRLPTDDVSLLSIRRSEGAGAVVSEEFIQWINSCPPETVVNLDLAGVTEPELSALSRLKRSTNLELHSLPSDTASLALENISHLTLSGVDFAAWQPVGIDLTSMQRLRFVNCNLVASPSFVEILKQCRRVTLRECQLDAESFECILAKKMNHLSFSRVALPMDFQLKSSVESHFLTLWDCSADPDRVLELVEARNAKEIQLMLDENVSEEQFRKLIEFPQVRFLRITAPWFTKQHALPLCTFDRDIQIVIFDSRMPIEDEEWIRENVATSVQIRIQRDPVRLQELGN